MFVAAVDDGPSSGSTGTTDQQATSASFTTTSSASIDTTSTSENVPLTSENMPSTSENVPSTSKNMPSTSSTPRYTQSDDDTTSEPRDSPEDMTSHDDTGCCVVCQTSAVTCVLLPCRHACVCRQCFTRVTQCPICRSHIMSYFSLVDNRTPADHWSTEEDDPDLVSDSRFVRWNAKINHFLGFR